MMQAESQADNLVTGNRGRFIALIIMAVLIIGLIVTCNIKSDVDHKRNMEWIRGLSTSISTDMDKVNAALQTTATSMRDINGDGLINCIDAAVIFYGVYPDKRAVRIVHNTKGTWSHLFNEVKIDGVWKAIEPQAQYTNLSSIYMKDVWSQQYDPSRNRNVTSDYLRYVK